MLGVISLRRSRAFGDCRLGLTLWRELLLDEFWGGCLSDARGDVAWEHVLSILAINRLVAPGSEWRIHREWFLQTALDELLGVDFAAAAAPAAPAAHPLGRDHSAGSVRLL